MLLLTPYIFFYLKYKETEVTGKFFISFELSFTYIKDFYLNANNELCFTIKPQSLAHYILIIKCNPWKKSRII